MFSPHLDHYKSQNIEVLLLTEPIDSFMLMGLTKYKEIELKNIAASDELKTDEEKKEEKEKAETGENKGLVEVFKNVLGEKVADVRVSSTLSTSVARLVDEDGGMNPEMQRVYRYLGKDFDQPKKVLEINTTHPLVEGINALNGQAELQAKLIEQVLDSASILEGVTPDPAKMVQRIQELMSVILDKSK
jgi:molecular chaperone HtpG